MPMPTMSICRTSRRPQCPMRRLTTPAKSMPWACAGFPITTHRAPACRAAATLSAKPPLSPEAFVTSHWARMAFSVATFISTEKGPCMAMICAGAKPAMAQASNEDAMGSTRG